MGPKGVAEPHCLKPMPTISPFPQAPGCLPAPKKPRGGWPRPFHHPSQLRPGLTPSAGEINRLPSNIQSQQGQMCGIAGRTGHEGEAAQSHLSLPTPLQNIFHLLPSVGGLGRASCCPLHTPFCFLERHEASLLAP